MMQEQSAAGSSITGSSSEQKDSMHYLREALSILTQKNYFLNPAYFHELKKDFDMASFLEFIKNSLQRTEQPIFLDQTTILKFKIKREEERKEDYSVRIINSFEEKTKKRKVEDFVSYFKSRYSVIKDILQQKQELQDAMSISKAKISREKTAVIGLVGDVSFSKFGNCKMLLEDPSGEISVNVQKTSEAFQKTKSVVLDEVVGVTGSIGQGGILFAHDIIFPDVPLRELKKATDEIYAVFTADMHIGSNLFFEREFESFISWLNCESGEPAQRLLASKVKYLFIVGDLVDGIGVYPEQEKELAIKEINEQYTICSGYIKKIRKDINIIICGGNHDALRICEPQPPLNPIRLKELYEQGNISFVSNPSLVNIHSSENFSGFDVLIYHGYSLDYYAEGVDSIRYSGLSISDRTDLVKQLLLQKRHLAPAHTSTLYIPSPLRDPLIIEKVPDIFVTAHIHKASVGSYRNITLLSCSCWQGKTLFQEKVGHEPEPNRIILLNLKTRHIKILKFGGE